MGIHVTLIAAAAATLAASVGAEPPKAEVHQASQPAKTPTEVALASADQVRAPAPSEQPSTTPVKRPRAARVTTCRCGDPDPADSASDQ
jgi:hypothetical protein